MANKRPPIEIADISENLKASTGQGFNAFFPSAPPAPAMPTSRDNETSVLRNHGTGVPGNRGTTVPVGKRKIKRRHPYDVYFDQIMTLKEFSLEEKRAGDLGSESAMVREAIDAYIEKRRKK
jgi:hypothetical protein